jgi:hypothetical protein
MSTRFWSGIMKGRELGRSSRRWNDNVRGRVWTGLADTGTGLLADSSGRSNRL